MPIVSTGQITIIDQNDARSITAAISSNNGVQQVYTKDESIILYTPSWSTSANTLTPQISVGGLTTAQSWARLQNKKFTLTPGGTALTTASTSTSFVNNSDVAVSTPFTITHAADGSTTASTMAIGANLKDSVGIFTVYFEADYVDAATGLSTRIVAQISLNTVKTGTNAVFITLRGQTAFEEATGQTKNVIAIAADLVRSGGIDTTNLSYKWYENNAADYINGAAYQAGGANQGKFGLKTTTGVAPTGITSDLNQNIPTTAAGNAFNTLVISETAVTDLEVFKVEITDGDSKTYTAYFTVYDVSDPYDVKVISSTGDKMVNGQGNATLTPRVYNGSAEVTTLTGYNFTWYIYDKNGNRSGFIDVNKTGTIGNGTGANITAHTIGTSATITYDGTANTFAAGDLIKCVTAAGDAYIYEVFSSSGNVITIRTPVTNAWLTFSMYAAPTTNQFVNGKIYTVTASGTKSSTGSSVANSQIIVYALDIDVKGNIIVEANRP